MVGPLPGPCICGSFSAPGCPYLIIYLYPYNHLHISQNDIDGLPDAYIYQLLQLMCWSCSIFLHAYAWSGNLIFALSKDDLHDFLGEICSGCKICDDIQPMFFIVSKHLLSPICSIQNVHVSLYFVYQVIKILQWLQTFINYCIFIHFSLRYQVNFQMFEMHYIMLLEDCEITFFS